MLRPSDEEILDAVREHGSVVGASRALGYGHNWLSSLSKREPELGAKIAEVRAQTDYHGRQRERPSVTVREDEATLVFSTDSPALGDIGQLIRECGLDPEDWVVVSCTLNRWEGMTAAQWDEEAGEKRNQKMPLNQWKVTLRRAPHLILATPAAHVPPVKRPRKRPTVDKPELIVVEGDHQVPYQDPGLHVASLYALEELHRQHNLVEHVFLGDTGDYPTISKHADHPAADATVNKVIQGSYELLREKREAAPNARARKLKGNHDWRVEAELLLRAERMYGIRPASIDGEEELPALSLRRLLHLDALGVELVEDPRGWEHAEVELLPGMAGLVVRHGWLTSANSAAKSVAKRGRSMIVGHTHRPEHYFGYDPSAGLIRQAVTAPAMCLARDERFPHFAVLDTWLQGFVTVMRWPDGRFAIEFAIWDGKCLRWRDRSWTP